VSGLWVRQESGRVTIGSGGEQSMDGGPMHVDDVMVVQDIKKFPDPSSK
jgi:hypothetical protein